MEAAGALEMPKSYCSSRRLVSQASTTTPGGDACECVRQHDRVSYRVNDGLRSVSSRRLASCDAEQSLDVGGDDASPCHLDELGVDAVDRGGRLAGGRRESHSCGSVWTHPIHAH